MLDGLRRPFPAHRVGDKAVDATGNAGPRDVDVLEQLLRDALPFLPVDPFDETGLGRGPSGVFDRQALERNAQAVHVQRGLPKRLHTAEHAGQGDVRTRAFRRLGSALDW